MKYTRVGIVVWSLSCFFYLLPATISYNMQVRRVFSIGKLLDINTEFKWNVIGLPYFFTRERTVVGELAEGNLCENRKGGGLLVDIHYTPSDYWWFDLTTALLKASTQIRGRLDMTESRIGFDDLVFAGGYTWYPTEKIQLILYGIGGMPGEKSLKTIELFDPLIGTRFYSLGFGYEFSYTVLKDDFRWLVFLFQNRFLHYFNRKVDYTCSDLTEVQPGNETDLLFTVQYRKGNNLMEVGYNPQFYTHDSLFLASKEVKQSSYVEHSFYGIYNRLIKSLPSVNRPALLGCGIIYGISSQDSRKNLDLFFNMSLFF